MKFPLLSQPKMDSVFDEPFQHLSLIPQTGHSSITQSEHGLYNRHMPQDRDRKSLWAVNLGLGINIFLAAIKTTFGILGHSPALLAEGINSISDVAYYVVAGIFVRLANKPADIEHPYGHRQLESIASLVVGAFVCASTSIIIPRISNTRT
jgi:Co/Zn/Cd efflux system component